MRYQRRRIQFVLAATACVWIGVALTMAQGPAPLSPADLRAMAASRTGSLKTVPVADAPTFNQYVRDRGALMALGKALFWDQQLGSDGQSCASCHFHAGADSRSKNQLNPGFRAVPPRNGSRRRHTRMTAHRRRFSLSYRHLDNNAIVSSSGAFNATFDLTGFPTASGIDPGVLNPNPTFTDGTPASPVRNVEPRNTPTVINAVLNHRNFWDARARNEFNGVNPIGDLDPTRANRQGGSERPGGSGVRQRRHPQQLGRQPGRRPAGERARDVVPGPAVRRRGPEDARSESRGAQAAAHGQRRQRPRSVEQLARHRSPHAGGRV